MKKCQIGNIKFIKLMLYVRSNHGLTLTHLLGKQPISIHKTKNDFVNERKNDEEFD